MKKSVIGAGRLAKKFPQLKAKFVEVAVRETDAGAAEILTLARANAPVALEDGGDLVASLHRTKSEDGLRHEVVASAPHAKHVEFGTSKMGAQPYMIPAAEQVIPRRRRRIQSEMRKAAKEVAGGK